MKYLCVVLLTFTACVSYTQADETTTQASADLGTLLGDVPKLKESAKHVIESIIELLERIKSALIDLKSASPMTASLADNLIKYIDEGIDLLKSANEKLNSS